MSFYTNFQATLYCTRQTKLMSHVWKESRGSRGPIGNSKFKMHGAEARHLSIKYKVTTSFARLAWEGSKDGGRENKLWNITRHTWNILHHDILVQWKKCICMCHFECWCSGYNYKHSERLLINNIVFLEWKAYAVGKGELGRA
jgi:hypothetical protein